MSEFLDIKTQVEKLQKMYREAPKSSSWKILLLGESGTGKTFLLRTARKPIHLDCFDPGNTKNLKELITKGELVPDIRWENEDPTNPSVFREWEKVMKERLRTGYFDHFGTYCLDSSTTWTQAIMNQQMKSEGLAGKPPRFTHDYTPQKAAITNWISDLMRLPCDFIFTGHLEGNKDEVSGQMSYRYMVTGKASITIPLLFDEIWVMDPKQTSNGVEYRILTQATGRHLARSRMAAAGLLKAYEKPDIKAMLKKCGQPYEDKPLFT
jgi:hypothetical protein